MDSSFFTTTFVVSTTECVEVFSAPYSCGVALAWFGSRVNCYVFSLVDSAQTYNTFSFFKLDLTALNHQSKLQIVYDPNGCIIVVFKQLS